MRFASLLLLASAACAHAFVAPDRGGPPGVQARSQNFDLIPELAGGRVDGALADYWKAGALGTFTLPLTSPAEVLVSRLPADEVVA